MIVHEFFLDRLIEAFAMSVHLWRLGIGVIVDEVQTPQFFVKMFHELATVVSQNKSNGKWKYFEAQSEKFFCCQ